MRIQIAPALNPAQLLAAHSNSTTLHVSCWRIEIIAIGEVCHRIMGVSERQTRPRVIHVCSHPLLHWYCTTDPKFMCHQNTFTMTIAQLPVSRQFHLVSTRQRSRGIFARQPVQQSLRHRILTEAVSFNSFQGGKAIKGGDDSTLAAQRKVWQDQALLVCIAYICQKCMSKSTHTHCHAIRDPVMHTSASCMFNTTKRL